MNTSGIEPAALREEIKLPLLDILTSRINKQSSASGSVRGRNRFENLETGRISLNGLFIERSRYQAGGRRQHVADPVGYAQRDDFIVRRFSLVD